MSMRFHYPEMYLRSLSYPGKKVVVFDIDETLYDSVNDKPIHDTILFYHIAKNLGYKTAIVTARSNTFTDETILLLDKLGVTGYEIIFFYSNFLDIPEYKKEARRYIHQNIGPVVMSIGDQLWDMGEYGGYGVKL